METMVGGRPDNFGKKHICIGLLAHVDAGKTTLSEAMLYRTGSIRRLGRVDNRDSFLDTEEMERARGITIFSKQAVFSLGDFCVTLLDTPGHVDFSAEMERTLQVLDYAILIISGADGVQGHTETLWRLLKRYEIPTFLFVNKMDQPGTDRQALLAECRKQLDENCLDFGQSREQLWESLAMADERALETFLASGRLETEEIVSLIAERKVFPCWFGSALKLDGVEEFLSGLSRFMRCPARQNGTAARVYKISRDDQGNRLTHLKVTGGILHVREPLPGCEAEKEKISQIRIYSGSRYETVTEAEAGCVCAVVGLTTTKPGQVFGEEDRVVSPLLEPVLTYQIKLPDGCDAHTILPKLRQLEEEEPELHISWDELHKELQAQVMGDVQIEVLRQIIADRFGIDVEFGVGSIVYKETVTRPVEGVGHFEPLRHYAEVHLLLEPGERGSGLQFLSRCSEDVLDRNWQRLILTHLEEKVHRGVLIGAELTDVRITLIAGRAHQKHTEGGDFRQATYRAVRQGLMEAGCHLLEPYYEYRLELPSQSLGRAMADMERMQGTLAVSQMEETGTAVLTGKVPVAAMRDYQREVASYTHGCGRLSCSFYGYEPCRDEAEIVKACDYDPEADLENPTGSVFCAHGAGFVVPWYEVKRFMHVESGWQPEDDECGGEANAEKLYSDEGYAHGRTDRRNASVGGVRSGIGQPFGADDKELEAIFTRTYGETKRRFSAESRPREVIYRKEEDRPEGNNPNKALQDSFGARGSASPGYEKAGEQEDYLLVDGYNIIYAWEELSRLARDNVDAARHKLMDILCNYQSWRGGSLIVVFDAYKVSGNIGSAIDYHNIHVVYTKEAETADQYIEKLAHQIGRKYRVTVATSDGLEQLIIRGQGCLLMSARELKEDVARVNGLIEEERQKLKRPGKRSIFEDADADVSDYLENVRREE